MSHRAIAERFCFGRRVHFHDAFPVTRMTFKPTAERLNIRLRNGEEVLRGQRGKMTDMFTANTKTGTEVYLSGFSFDEYLDDLRHGHPEVAAA
jgi:hypothetical protein